MYLPKLSLTINELRSLVLEALKSVDSTNYLNVCNSVAGLLIQKGIVTDPNQNGRVFYTNVDYALNPLDEDNVREIIWNLIVEGVLTIGINPSNANWPWLKVTEYGKVMLQSSEPIPHDPSGYLARLTTEVPDINTVILTYITESLRTYNINCLLSATIALGCASEKALLLLIEAYTNYISTDETRKKFIQATQGKMIKRQFEEFNKRFETVKGTLPGDIEDGSAITLIGVFEMIRNNRNDAGHPTGKMVDKNIIYSGLQVFIPYCKKVYQLISYFNDNASTR
ncbi:hypothetical protein [Paenibacillus sp. 22594]|uniref:hypothetical protein n=1 Tax=Paenibacillus sp. 22594 TaxID=3453947 RepID=UPI003F824243